jgi:predicted phosphodiesterase
LILGHTHRQAVRYLSDDVLWLNPGSASYRRRDDPDQTAHYATIVDGRISLHRLDYHRSPLYQAVQSLAINDLEKQSGLRIFQP